jgi:hypothetical protein
MRSLLIFILFFIGCVGSPAPQNPMMKPVNYSEAVWWRLDTSGMKPEDNPWNKFVPIYKVADRANPWAEFKEPQLFPKDWKHKEKSTKPTGSIKKILVEQEVY